MKIAKNMAPQEYRNAQGISASQIKKALRSLEHMDTPQPSSDAMNLGTALHMLVLEPERFDETYTSADIDRRTKEGKAKADEIAASGKTLIKPDDFDAVRAMRDSILRSPAARGYFDGSSTLTTEVSVFWEDEDVHSEIKVPCKLRADAIVKGASMILDIKTTQDASADGFARSVVNFGYHVQAAHYLSAGAASESYPRRFRFVAVETVAPWSVGVYELDAAAMEAGYALREKGIRRIIDGDAREQWRGYTAGLEPQSLSLPAWALRTAGVY